MWCRRRSEFQILKRSCKRANNKTSKFYTKAYSFPASEWYVIRCTYRTFFLFFSIIKLCKRLTKLYVIFFNYPLESVRVKSFSLAAPTSWASINFAIVAIEGCAVVMSHRCFGTDEGREIPVNGIQGNNYFSPSWYLISWKQGRCEWLLKYRI